MIRKARMNGSHPPANWQRIDLTPKTEVRAPFFWLMMRQVSSTFGRGLRFGLLLAAVFWAVVVAVVCWLAF